MICPIIRDGVNYRSLIRQQALHNTGFAERWQADLFIAKRKARKSCRISYASKCIYGA